METKAKEISHYSDLREACEIFTEEFLKILLETSDTCSVFDCSCVGCNIKDPVRVKSSGPYCCCASTKHSGQKEKCCSTSCYCKETADKRHIHSENCKHKILFHDDHVDYIVSGKLHSQRSGECTHHGILILKTEETKDFFGDGPALTLNMQE